MTLVQMLRKTADILSWMCDVDSNVDDNSGILLAGVSRVAKGAGTGDASELTRLLLEGRRAKDYSRLVAYLRDLPPSRLDAELRSMQVGMLL